MRKRVPVVLLVFGLFGLLSTVAAQPARAGHQVELQTPDGLAYTGPHVFAESAPGVTSAGPLLRMQSGPHNGKWYVYASVSGPLTKANGDVRPSGELEARPAGGQWRALSAERLVTASGGIIRTTTISNDFEFRFAPDSTADSGTYTGTVQLRVYDSGAPSHSVNVNFGVTVTITATMTIPSLVLASDQSAVTTFSLPEDAPGGAAGLATAAMQLKLPSQPSAKWLATVGFASAANQLTSVGGVVMPTSAVEVSSPELGGYTPLPAVGSTLTLDSAIPRATLLTDSFTFRLNAPAGQDSGSYTGTITLTATTV